MTATQEKPNLSLTSNLRQNAIRQTKKIFVSIFNYCFLVYFFLAGKIKKYAHYSKGILLDVGCGACPYESYFVKNIDKYLKHEHPLAAKPDIKYDYLSELPQINAPSNSFDTIVSFAVLEHVSRPFDCIKEFNRILKPNGRFIIFVPQYWHLHEEPHDYLRFTKHILKEELPKQGFNILHLEETGRSYAVCGQAICNAIILMFDLNHVKNIYNFITGGKTQNIGKSLIYTLYKSPLILLSLVLIPIVNVSFLILDLLFGSPRDTIGYFVVAEKK